MKITRYSARQARSKDLTGDVPCLASLWKDGGLGIVTQGNPSYAQYDVVLSPNEVEALRAQFMQLRSMEDFPDSLRNTLLLFINKKAKYIENIYWLGQMEWIPGTHEWLVVPNFGPQPTHWYPLPPLEYFIHQG